MSQQAQPLLEAAGTGRPPPSSAASSLNRGLVTAALLASLGAAGFGFGIGAPNPLETVIESDLEPVVTHNSIQWAAVLASFTAAGFAATRFTPQLVDKHGRRPVLVAIQVLYAIGGAFLLIAGLARTSAYASYSCIIVGRLISGFGAGAATVVVPLYLGEIAPRALAGAFGTLNQLQVTVWILIAQALGIGMSTSALWGWLFGIGGALGALTAVLSAFVLPESPSWLVARGRLVEARAALARLRAPAAAVDDEIEGMRRADEEASAHKQAPSLREILADGGLRRATIIAVGLQVAQQLSGINAVFFYSSSIFSDAGISNPNLATLACGGVNVAATALAVYIIDRLGRRPLLLSGALGMLVSAAALTATLAAKASHPDSTALLGGVSIVFVLLFVAFFEIGLGPIPWCLAGEMLPEGPRSTIMAVGSAANWVFTTVVALTFPSVQTALGNYSFVPFCVFLALTFLFTFLMVPETRNRDPAEVLRSLTSGKSPRTQDERALGYAARSMNAGDPESDALMRVVEASTAV